MKNNLNLFNCFFSFLFIIVPVLSHSEVSVLSIKDDTIVFQIDTMYLEPIGKTFQFHEFITEYQSNADMGGNTSVRNVSNEELKWKTEGYYQRNRDLGQMFIPKKDTWLKSIVLRTGPAESAVLYDTPGAKVFMQFFEVFGDPVINDNGTPKGTQSKHGFNTNHRTDDFIEGVEYASFPTIYTGVFPEEVPVTKDADGNTLGNAGRLYYIRWKFENPVFFEANKRYGFMVGFLDEGLGLGFTLANANRAAISDEPSLDDRHTPYKGGWSYRREGDGTLPPTMVSGDNPPDSDSLVYLLKSESLFYQGFDRFRLSPTSDGYPDVDTYRAFEFYIEEEFVALVGIVLNTNDLSLEVGQEFSLEAQVIPEDATKNNIIWFSSNASVAKVDSIGLVKGISVGQSAITAFTEDYSFYETCLVTVKDALTSADNFEIINNNSLTVFPNPCSFDMLTIQNANSIIEELSIVTMEGIQVFKANINNNQAVLDVSKLKPGSYIAIVRNRNISSVKSFIIK